MLIDGRTLPERERLETDLCIIGAGAAGITLAQEFAGQPVRVCLVEAGAFEFEDGVQELYRGESVGLPYNTYDTRLRFFGGSTNHWGGYCRPFDPFLFEPRPWIPSSGWPIGHTELEPYYAKAARLCEIGPVDLDPLSWANQLELPLFDLGETGPLRNAIFQISPPTRFGEAYREPLLAAENVTLCLHGSVVRLAAAASGDRLERIELKTLAGNAFSVRAKCYVLACGGIENARLLLASNDVESTGLGNRHDQVGRCFMEHAHFDLGRLVLAEPEMDLGLYLHGNALVGGGAANAHLGMAPEVQRDEQIANPLIQLRPRVPSAGEKSLWTLIGSLKLGHYPDDLGEHLWRVLADIGPVSRHVGHRMAQELFGADDRMSVLSLRSVGEQVPNPDSRITLAATTDALGMPQVKLDWRLSELDLRTQARAGQILAREAGRLGLGRVQLPRGDDLTARLIEPGNHHMGTTRMSDDPKEGVVDRDCRVHGVGNLYVGGSSVFPVSGGGTPTLTIVALALRLADHLKAGVFGLAQATADLDEGREQEVH